MIVILYDSSNMIVVVVVLGTLGVSAVVVVEGVAAASAVQYCGPKSSRQNPLVRFVGCSLAHSSNLHERVGFVKVEKLLL
jgi:hypothetical protein